ncbi:proline-rich protein PRCC [Garra rufa]|uniref:proline-rich protein PRCC n=1 Tax=Garra rufa TaxID=137080 RepID=UPI003CCEA1BF
MSLVAYDSSDDSDRDDSPGSAARPVAKIGGLFASLPAPKNAKIRSSADQTSAPQPKRMTMDLPKPKKRTEPVKITVPEIKPADSDSDDDEPARKKSAPQTGEYQQQYQEYPEIPLPETSPQDYYGEGYYQDPNPAADEQDDSGSSSMLNDEAFRRLQGKQNRGREEIKFLEIKGDDQLSGNKQWMTKNMTAEAEPRKSFSKKKGDQPTGQQRRKHQITYLIHQAKERELELKNNWAENKLTRRQTQAKYGF